MPEIGNEQASTITRVLTKKPKRGKRQKKTHKKGATFKRVDDNWNENKYTNEETTDNEDMRLLVHCNKMLNAHERRIADGLLVQQCFRAHRQDEQRRRRRRHKKVNKSDDERKDDDDDSHPSLHLTVKI